MIDEDVTVIEEGRNIEDYLFNDASPKKKDEKWKKRIILIIVIAVVVIGLIVISMVGWHFLQEYFGSMFTKVTCEPQMP